MLKHAVYRAFVFTLLDCLALVKLLLSPGDGNHDFRKPALIDEDA